MDSLKDIISDIRVFLYGGIRSLPLTIAGTTLILGLFTANLSFLFFLLGFLILTPLVAYFLNLALTGVFGGYSWFKASTSDVCNLVIPYTKLSNAQATQATQATQAQMNESVILSSWMAMVSFFIGYVFTNALELYNRESPDVTLQVNSSAASDLGSKVTTRKTQAIVAMVSIVIFALIIIGFRFYTGCESVLGIILTAVLFIFAGNGWYQALSSVGQDRLSDLFGIANRLLTPGAISNAPIACVPIRV